MISYGAKQLRDLSISFAKEWLLADGDGGFASSTLCFMNTRREHSMLTVSANLPLRRLTLLNKVDEEVIIDDRSYFLATNQYPGAVFPEGYKLLSRFTFDYFPQVIFDLDGNQLMKKIIMPKRSSSIYIHYENLSRKPITVRLLPLLSFRWKNALKKSGDGFLVDELPDGVRIISDMNLPRLYLKLSQIYSTSPESYWYYNFIYPRDGGVYENDREDLYNIGYWETELEPGKEMTFAASTRDLAEFDYDEIETHFIESVEKTRSRSKLPTKYVRLADIASNHIVRNKAIRSPAIMEGYPYGGISIKESLLSLDGVSLVSENSNYDMDFLYDLAANEVSGAFPSRVDEMTLHVEYDDPQIPFYFAFALGRCAERSKSTDCVKRYLPILEEAIETIGESNLGGTRSMESGLLDITGGGLSSLRDVVTNAAVNALWFNLLTIAARAKSPSSEIDSDFELASEIETNYFRQYFEDDGSYKYSSGTSNLLVEMVLPLILEHSPLNEEQRTKVCKNLTAMFIKSLDPDSRASHRADSCNLIAIYLTDAAGSLRECGEEFKVLKGYFEKLLSGQDYTHCLNGIPKCAAADDPQFTRDISSSVMVGEAIRLINKFKLR